MLGEIAKAYKVPLNNNGGLARLMKAISDAESEA